MTVTIELPTPESFSAFPYNPPYEIQVDLMRHLYSSIEQKKVTIVESPTGTGKTLSLLCASLTWLKDDKERAKKGKLSVITGDGVDAKDWVVQQTLERARRDLEADEEDYELRLAKARKREAAMKKMARARVLKKQRRVEEGLPNIEDEDESQFLPEDGSDEESDMNISPALRALMAKLEKPLRPGYTEGEVEPTCSKIYYASRTHSQLAQILPELQKLKLQLHAKSYHDDVGSTNGFKRTFTGAGLDQDEDEDDGPCARTLSLGSRKQLCINDDLRAKSKDLDESCRELLNEKGAKRCQFLPPQEEESRLLDFRDQVLASPKDIEDLAEAGRMAQVCPYFGSRRAIPQAELVTLPYNLLLQRTAREALGIDLTDQIVIVDEAHNLIPTLLSLSTCILTSSILTSSFQQVCAYVTKFRNRLNPANLLQLKRLVVFMDALKKFVVDWRDSRLEQSKSGHTTQNQSAEVLTVAQLMERMGKKVAGVNLLEIEKYLNRSKIARKIAGYSDKQAEKDANAKLRSKGATPPLYSVEAFMLALTGANDDGRLTISLINQEVELKYHLFNPSPQFKEVVEVARSVILAGGTMSPISDVVNQLFSYVELERFSSFSCGHIIPKSNLQTLVVSKGPRNGELHYKADKQSDPAVIMELGQILLNFTGVIPAGMVVFFPSYNFLNKAKAAWQTNGILEKLSKKKKIFFEPAESTDVEKVMQEYAAAVKAPTPEGKVRGALLLAVVGAKLSEGLNFADDLARAVVVIGLPFANLGSPELKERLEYVKRLEKSSHTKRESGQKDAAAELYENMCMNAVNQSIGRAIRHRQDWASLILLDRRYASTSIRKKLPKWIGDELTVTEGFGATMNALGTFYRNKRQTT